MEPVTSTHYLIIIMLFGTICLSYLFILRPLNRKYERALNRLLGKEIARRIYQELSPEFSYQGYHEDDTNKELILRYALEEFRRLRMP